MRNSSKYKAAAEPPFSTASPPRQSRGSRHSNLEPTSHEPSPERHYTVSEVAAIYRVVPRTVRNWINDGKMRALRKERLIRVPLSSLREFNESH